MKLPPAWMGLLLIALHLAGVMALMKWCRRESLVVRHDGPVESGAITAARVSESLRDRVVVTVDGAPVGDLDHLSLGAGMHRFEWSITYRGGIERRVGLTRLAGPRQRPDEPHCGLRLHVSQSLLDDGNKSPGTLAYALRQRLVKALGGWEVERLGKLQHVGGLSLNFRHDGGGQLVAHTGFVFEHGTVPLSVIAEPEVRDGRLEWETSTNARVVVTEGFRSFVVKLFRLQDNVDRSATKLGASRVSLLVADLALLLERPLEFELPNDKTLSLVYCDDEPIRITDDEATIPLAVVPIDGEIEPIDLEGADEAPPFDGRSSFAIDADLDTINAILHALWASGYLDEIAGRELIERFNASAQVRQYLTIRLEDLRFTLPPTVELSGCGESSLRVSAEVEASIDDRGLRTRGFAFVQVAVELGTDQGGSLALGLEVENISVSCEARPGVLEPCYPSLVDLARRSALDAAGPIADSLGEIFDRRFGAGRFESRDLGTSFTVRAGRLSFHPNGRSGWIRLALDLAFAGDA
jgi:hypothetical protein